MKQKIALGSMLCMSLLGGLQAAENSVIKALKSGKPTVELRYRYEMVDDDTAGLAKGHASTLRTALGYKTASLMGFSAYVEMEDVTILGEQQFSGGGRAGVLDPEGTAVNESYLAYQGKTIEGKFGRQTIIFDNARMIGNVGWRQNDQTFDGVSLKAKAGAFNITYAHLWRQNAITFAQNKLKTNLLNANVKTPIGKLSAYAYLKDMDDSNTADTDTYGIRLAGAKPLNSDLKLLYTAEYAKQTEGGDVVTSFDENYLLAELGLGFSGMSVKLGYENLTASSTGSFKSPFGTVHAFNGWADKTNNQGNGIKDTYLSVGGKVKGVKLLAVYHVLDADMGNSDYGSEIDALVAYKTSFGPLLGAKAAFFDADSASGKTDVNKVWLWTQYSF